MYLFKTINQKDVNNSTLLSAAYAKQCPASSRRAQPKTSVQSQDKKSSSMESTRPASMLTSWNRNGVALSPTSSSSSSSTEQLLTPPTGSVSETFKLSSSPANLRNSAKVLPMSTRFRTNCKNFEKHFCTYVIVILVFLCGFQVSNVNCLTNNNNNNNNSSSSSHNSIQFLNNDNINDTNINSSNSIKSVNNNEINNNNNGSNLSIDNELIGKWNSNSSSRSSSELDDESRISLNENEDAMNAIFSEFSDAFQGLNLQQQTSDDSYSDFNTDSLSKRKLPQMPVYLNEFAVHIPAGWEVADAIASKYGFTNMGQIGSLKNYYLFHHRHISKRSLSTSDSHHSALKSEPEVRWMQQQHEKLRPKRDYKPDYALPVEYNPYEVLRPSGTGYDRVVYQPSDPTE